MITKWKLSNFKSVRKETELPFAPLTIFAGANSSGKSSWIQSILMISQTLAHRISSRSVVLNGVLSRLGQFDDLRSFDSEMPGIVIGWECRPWIDQGQVGALFPAHRTPSGVRQFENIKSVCCEISFDAAPSPPEPETSQLHPSLVSTTLSCISKDEEGNAIGSRVKISRTDNFNQKVSGLTIPISSQETQNKILQQSLEFDVSLDDPSIDEIHENLASALVVGCLLRHFLPMRLTARIDSVDERARILGYVVSTGRARPQRAMNASEQDIVFPKAIVDLLKQHLGPSFPIPPETEMQGDIPHDHPAARELTLRDWTDAMRKLSPIQQYRLRDQLRGIAGLYELIVEAATKGKEKEFVLRFIGIPDQISEATSYLDTFFSNFISYLGPLRDEPKPLYPLPTSPDLAYVGLKGEYTAAVLDLHKNRYVEYIPPSCFQGATAQKQVSSNFLQRAVSDWLQYLGVAESVHTHDMGKLGHELRVQTPGIQKSHDLTHAGVGVSQ